MNVKFYQANGTQAFVLLLSEVEDHGRVLRNHFSRLGYAIVAGGRIESQQQLLALAAPGKREGEQCKPVTEELVKIRLKSDAFTDTSSREWQRDAALRKLELEIGDTPRVMKIVEELRQDLVKIEAGNVLFKEFPSDLYLR